MHKQTDTCSLCVCALTRVQQLLLHHSTAQHLHPVALETHLHLKGGMSEGEVTVDPPDLHICGREEEVAKVKKTEEEKDKDEAEEEEENE